MRLLLATDSFPRKIDGVSDTSRKLAEGLAARGHEVRVIAPAPRGGWTGVARVARVRSVPCPLYPELRLAVNLPRVWALARGRWDGAIVMTPGPIGVTVAASLSRRTPLINVYTTDIPRYLQTYGLDQVSPVVERGLRWMANRAQTTLAPTTFVHDELRRREFPRVEVWGRGVDTELFQPARRSDAMRRRLSGGQPERPLALFVGRLAREKNVAALGEVLRSAPAVRLAVVGDGPARPELEAALGTESVVFTGYLRGQELASAFASADTFVFPSESETFGQVVLQAMASGVPPVVIAGSAPAELVPCGIAGLHVAPGRPEAIAQAVRMLVACPELRASMATAAVECARRYSWAALIERMEALLGASPEPVPAGSN